MAVPAIKALQSLGSIEVLDVLVGDTPDDFGASQILGMGVLTKGKVFINRAIETTHQWNSVPVYYDLAILAIPFDGRWKNEDHFYARHVVDGRTRPDPTTAGLVSWKKHEIEYQMENAENLGYSGPIPDCSFFPWKKYEEKEERVFIGVGYKKDTAGFWKIKHWGNENYNVLIRGLLDHGYGDIISTGDMMDLKLSMAPIKRMVGNACYRIETPSFAESVKIVSESRVYIGNDTGMMHVAAAAGCRTIGLFLMGNDSIVKSAPWGANCLAVDLLRNKSMHPNDIVRMI